MFADETLNRLKQWQAIIDDDHFVYASGDHGKAWINKDIINLKPEQPMALAKRLAEQVQAAGIQCDIVCAPATGGVIISQYLAYYLGVLSVFTDKDPTQQKPLMLKRRYDQVVKGKRVLIADDVVNTGHSILQTRDAVAEAGGQVVAMASFINRGNVYANDLGIDDFVFLLDYAMPAWPADACPLCQQGQAVNTDFAHGAEFVHQRGY